METALSPARKSERTDQQGTWPAFGKPAAVGVTRHVGPSGHGRSVAWSRRLLPTAAPAEKIRRGEAVEERGSGPEVQEAGARVRGWASGKGRVARSRNTPRRLSGSALPERCRTKPSSRPAMRKLKTSSERPPQINGERRQQLLPHRPRAGRRPLAAILSDHQIPEPVGQSATRTRSSEENARASEMATWASVESSSPSRHARHARRRTSGPLRRGWGHGGISISARDSGWRVRPPGS